MHRESEKRAFSLENVVLTKVTRRRYKRGEKAPVKPRSGVSATHDRELAKSKTAPCIGLYTQIYEKEKIGVLSDFDTIWWPGPGSNRRHTDFQSVALPTELPSHGRSQGLNGRSAGIRTLDPVIKSHLLYQLSYAPIHLGFWSEERDSNPRQPPWQGGTLPTELSSHRENGE